MTVRVALIDDQRLVREGIRGLLELAGTIDVVAEGSDGDEVDTIAANADPDVWLMDIRMPRVSGIDAIRRLRDAGHDRPVIILTTFDDPNLVMQGIAAGARGFLLKDVSLERLIEAIETVHAGGTVVQPVITQSLLDHVAGRDVGFDSLSIPDELTPRETEILRLMAGGYSNREIAQMLENSEGTVKNHVSNVLSKLGVRDRTRAVLKAIAAGLL